MTNIVKSFHTKVLLQLCLGLCLQSSPYQFFCTRGIKASQTSRKLSVQSRFMYWKVNKWESLISTNNTISDYDLSNTQAKKVQDPAHLNEKEKANKNNTTWCYKIDPHVLWATAAFQRYYTFPAVSIVPWEWFKRGTRKEVLLFWGKRTIQR